MDNVEYEGQRLVADSYLEDQFRILENNAFRFVDFNVSNFDKDTKEATDVVVDSKGSDIALRVREPNIKFRDITIRNKSFGGGETEIDKMRKGYGDWYLYGWGNGNGKVVEYVLLDIEKIREYQLFDMTLSGMKRSVIPNKDGRTNFISIDIAELDLIGAVIDMKLLNDTKKDVDRKRMQWVQAFRKNR